MAFVDLPLHCIELYCNLEASASSSGVNKLSATNIFKFIEKPVCYIITVWITYYAKSQIHRNEFTMLHSRLKFNWVMNSCRDNVIQP